MVDRATSQERLLDADLVVDATGRSARTPALLETHAYAGPPEQKYDVGLSYPSQFFRVPDGALADKMVLVGPTVERPTGAGVLAYENGTLIPTLIGVARHRLPIDLPEMIELASLAVDLAPPQHPGGLVSAVLEKLDDCLRDCLVVQQIDFGFVVCEKHSPPPDTRQRRQCGSGRRMSASACQPFNATGQ
jgi:hypothetical protein